MTQLPTDHDKSARTPKRAKRAICLAVPALLAVSGVAWLGLDAVREPDQPSSAARPLMLAIKTPSLHEYEQARLAMMADAEGPMAAKPQDSVTEPSQTAQETPEPAAPAPLVEETPQPVAAVIAAPVTPSVTVAEPDNCATELRRFAQDQIIRFSSGRADLEDSDLPVLRRIGRMAEDCPNIVIQVKGHSDSTGSDVINLALSWERADNTIATLAALGVDTQKFEPIGFGARAPLAQGDTSDDHFNRRVEFQVFTTEETTP